MTLSVAPKRRHQAWRDVVYTAALTPSQRRLAIKVFAQAAAADGTVSGGAERLARRYAEHTLRGTCSHRWLRNLLAGLIKAGLLEVAQRPGPGQPAVYRITVVEATRRMIVRRRGVLSPRIRKTFNREIGDSAWTYDPVTTTGSPPTTGMRLVS